jgi:hypothetical protein
MDKHILWILISILFFAPRILLSQETGLEKDSSFIEKGTLYKALAFTGAYYATSIYTLNNTWYKDMERVPFHFYNDNAGYLQVDKFGHMYGGYVYSYIGYFGLLKLGATRNDRNIIRLFKYSFGIWREKIGSV